MIKLFKHDGIDFYQRLWEPEGLPKGMLLVVHGIGEHSGRYRDVAKFFNGNGYLVAAYDQRGHGKSGGPKGYVEDWQVLVRDLAYWQEQLTLQYPDLPTFIFAHSLGGLVAYHYIVKHHPEIEGVILGSPALVVSKEISPLVQKIAPFLGKWFPRLKAAKLNAEHVSRDPRIVQHYIEDPLVNKDRVYARTGATILKATREVKEHYHAFSSPFLVMHGTADKLTDPQGSHLLYEHAAADDKSIKIYEGLYHELVNEPERMTVLNDMLCWLNERCT